MFKLLILMSDGSLINCGIHRSKKECGEVAVSVCQWLHGNSDTEPVLAVIVTK